MVIVCVGWMRQSREQSETTRPGEPSPEHANSAFAGPPIEIPPDDWRSDQVLALSSDVECSHSHVIPMGIGTGL